ncbi:MAG: cyclodeaminase/cyclohydrolase family protein [Firmicutes bacterium]|jgi:formiminotetrahydrofolate cyclodeaminase|nr:cyclodeaminase/cyclohydrolase family protein [Bacillota bacterium]
MEMKHMQISEFIEKLASKEPVPGGGGAAGLMGSVGAALGNMVISLTSGKKRYAKYEEDLARIREELTQLQTDLLSCIDEDAVGFYPLSQAYGIRARTDEEKAKKEEVLQNALKEASIVPMKIVRLCYRALELQEELADKGSALAISDVACGVQGLRAGLLSGRVNVLINLNMIKDEAFVKEVGTELHQLTEKGVALADAIFAKVEAKLM